MSENTELESRQYDPSVRNYLDQADWEVILPGLMKFATYQWKKLLQVGIGHLTPEDLVQEAISRAYGRGKNNAYRNWDREKCPDLAQFIKGIIRSIANHEIEHFFNFPSDFLDSEDEKYANIREESSCEAKDLYDGLSSGSPEDDVIKNENEIELIKRTEKLKTLAEEDEQMEMVMMCFEDGISKPSEIALNVGYDITCVYNVIKRLKRRVHDVQF